MKTKYLQILIIATCLCACNDSYLDVQPHDQITTATFFRTSDDALRAVTSVYDYWGGQGVAEDGFGYSFFLYLADTWTDDAFIPLDGYWYQRFQAGNLSPADQDLLSRWFELYFIVRRVNWVLANLGSPQMDESLRTRLAAEVTFIRAFQYFLLYQTWGEVPIVKQPLTLDELKVPRASTGETVDFILTDLEFSIQHLPVAYGGAEEGRITRGAAMGLKARVLLFAQRWQEAADAAKAVMDLGVYRLFQTPDGDGYRELFKTQNENNTEVIIDRENEAVKLHGNELPRLSTLKSTLGGDGFIAPAQSLVDAYEAYDPATDAIVSVDPANEFMNRDPRLRYTIAHPGGTFLGQTLAADTYPLANSRTRYGTIKFMVDEFNGNNGGVDYAVNHILMRYAEVLLTYAEARIELNQLDQTVIDAINAVRARAYGVDMDDTDHYPEIVLTDQPTMRKIVRNERRVELALEGLRWFDIRRWKIGSSVMGKPIYGAKVNGVNVLVRAAGTFDEGRDYLRPIPERERQLIGKSILTQNPGYPD